VIRQGGDGETDSALELDRKSAAWGDANGRWLGFSAGKPLEYPTQHQPRKRLNPRRSAATALPHHRRTVMMPVRTAAAATCSTTLPALGSMYTTEPRQPGSEESLSASLGKYRNLLSWSGLNPDPQLVARTGGPSVPRPALHNRPSASLGPAGALPHSTTPCQHAGLIPPARELPKSSELERRACRGPVDAVLERGQCGPEVVPENQTHDVHR